MSNRKATFAKRQREADLKDHAKAKEARRQERQSNPKTEKGPSIAWDELFQPPLAPDPADGDTSNLPPPTPPASDDSP